MSRTSLQRSLKFSGVVAAGWIIFVVQSFSAVSYLSSRSNKCIVAPILSMGLYDTPLPPRRPLEDNDAGDEDESEDDEYVMTSQRLFNFDVDGKEVRGLLPPLSRKLDSGIDCYYEENDRLVQNLVDKTSCLPLDAAWALEACKGDITEAWTRISSARRMILDESMKQKSEKGAIENKEEMASEADEVDWDELYARLSRPKTKEEILQEKLKRAEEIRQQKVQEFFKPGEIDGRWLPTENPKPIDDEPWFTG